MPHNRISLCAYCHIIEQQAKTDIVLDTIPTLVWQALGDDAVLTGFNEGMERLTGGGIQERLGVCASDFCREPCREYMRQCIRTRRAVVFESVHRMHAGPGTYRMLSMLMPAEDGRIVLYAYPLERIAERGRCN